MCREWLSKMMIKSLLVVLDVAVLELGDELLGVQGGHAAGA